MRVTYGDPVPAPPAPAVRIQAFAAFVRRATDQARQNRGWRIEDIATRAGISANTIYLWRSGEGKAFPQGQSVEAFCVALGIAPAAAFSVLWPGDDRPAEPMPLIAEDDLMVLARRLADPNVPEQEKYLIRETIRGLAARSGKPADGPERSPKRRGSA